MAEELYHIKFPKTNAIFMDNKLTFSISHIKSREVSTVYFIFTSYDMHENLIYTYNSERWVVDDTYSKCSTTFDIPTDVMEDSAYYQIELVCAGLSSENPLYFNQVMLNEGEEMDYHTPSEQIDSMQVKFNKNSYANLYTPNGNSLQVIRPKRDKFLTNQLTKSNCTVLSPHLFNEKDIDNPVNVFLEFINQTEQRIDVLR